MNTSSLDIRRIYVGDAMYKNSEVYLLKTTFNSYGKPIKREYLAPDWNLYELEGEFVIVREGHNKWLVVDYIPPS